MGNNDGQNLILLMENKYNRYAFWSQLNVYALSVRGIRLKDMPEEYFYFDISQSFSDLIKYELRCEVLFIELIGDCGKEIIEELYNLNLRKYIEKSQNHLSKQRLLYAYERIFLNSEEGSNKRLEDFKKLIKRNPYQAEIESEKELISLVDKTYQHINNFCIFETQNLSIIK